MLLQIYLNCKSIEIHGIQVSTEITFDLLYNILVSHKCFSEHNHISKTICKYEITCKDVPKF